MVKLLPGRTVDGGNKTSNIERCNSSCSDNGSGIFDMFFLQSQVLVLCSKSIGALWLSIGKWLIVTTLILGDCCGHI